MEINDLPRELKAKIIQGTDLSAIKNFYTKIFSILEASKSDGLNRYQIIGWSSGLHRTK